MKVFIAAIGFAAVVASAGMHAYAAEGDYVVVLKDAPVSLMSADDAVLPGSGVYVVDSYMDALSFAPSSQIECIFPDGIAYLFDDDEQSAPVNDPRYFDQWHLEYIHASYAWSRGFNGSGVKLGIVDSGMKDPSHADLPVPNSFYNVMNKADITDYSDSFGHGTKVAGIAAALTNNSVGIAGIAYGAELVPVKVTEGKSLYTSDMLSGIRVAVKLGCSVINVSAGFTLSSSSQETITSFGNTIKEFADNGVIIVAAAGNDNSTEYQYPASYDFVISVASSGRARTSDDKDKGYTEGVIMDRKADGSGYTYRTFLPDEPSTFTQHNDKVTLAAPGYEIFSTTYTGSYTRSSGTSFASPVVAGAAAIAKQIDPDLTFSEFKEAVIQTSKDIYTEGYDEYTGYGALDIRALTDYLLKTAPTHEPEPTKDPDATASPEPTEDPDGTASPKPTEDPDATASPEPTEDPDATASPEPTPTPEATDAPSTKVFYNGKYNISAVYSPAPSKAKVYFAFYRDGKLTAVKSNGVVEGSTSTSITYPSVWADDIEDDIDLIEIFIWDSDMTPCVPAQSISSGMWRQTDA